MRLAKDHFSLRTLLEEVHLTMEHSFPEVTQAMECNGMFCVIGSPRHLKQVLQNLARRDSAEHLFSIERPAFRIHGLDFHSRVLIISMWKVSNACKFSADVPKENKEKNGPIRFFDLEGWANGADFSDSDDDQTADVTLAVELIGRDQDRARPESPGCSTFRFTVSDCGCGISMAKQKEIFDEYAQVGVKRGTGMGPS